MRNSIQSDINYTYKEYTLHINGTKLKHS